MLRLTGVAGIEAERQSILVYMVRHVYGVLVRESGL
jgi:hypothetical protein